MRRFFLLSLGLAWLGGCSCQGKPAASAVPDSGASTASEQTTPTPVQEMIHPPENVIPERAVELHAQGRSQLDAGQYQEALQSFQQAQALAPNWYLPLHDSATAYILMGENDRALVLHEQLEKLDPEGFAQNKKMLDSLRREKDGRVPKGTLREFLAVEQVRDTAEQRGKLQALTKKAPNFVLAWRELALTAEDPVEGEQLVEKALTLTPDVETRGELLVHKGVLLLRRGKDEEARKLLGELMVDRSLLHSARSQAREVLNSPKP
ncbi:MAG TPA: tetratricopeptide repeat protein [Myxococcaceae bacterium]|jgi:tetratricopeptide (TPR) repeat protein